MDTCNQRDTSFQREDPRRATPKTIWGVLGVVLVVLSFWGICDPIVVNAWHFDRYASVFAIIPAGGDHDNRATPWAAAALASSFTA